MPENNNSNTVLPFLQGGGTMGELIRQYNWETTLLGEPINWPVQLKQQTGVLLTSLIPTLICWGTELSQLYNDAFMEVFGKVKHPEALGKPFYQTYAEAYDTLHPIVSKVLRGEAVAYPDFKLVLNHKGNTEEICLDLSCTPITDEYMNVHGVMIMCFEATINLSELKGVKESNEEISRSNRELVTDNEQLSSSQQNLRRIVYELAESEHRIRSIIDNAPFPIGVYLGADLRVSLANQAIIDVWGKGPDVIGKPYREILPELVDQAVFEQLDAVYRTGQTFHARNQRLDLVVNGVSTTSYFNYSFNAIRDQEGKIYGVMNTAADVTDAVIARQRVEEAADELAALNEELAASNEEMQSVNEELQSVNEELASTNEELNESRQQLQAANEELATSMSRLRMAIESTGLGTWEYIPVTDELFWSAELREIYGASPTEPATMEGFDAHIHPDDYDWVQQQIANAMNPSSGGHYDLSYRITRFDNSETRWIKVQGSVYFEDEQPVRFIGTAFDITEMKQAEEQTAKLAAIIASSDDAIISKNFDSIITSWNTSAERIFGYTADEMLGESLYKLIPADRHHEEPLILSSVREGRRVQHFETKRLTKSGSLIDVSVTVSPIRDKQGNIIGLSKIARDITEKKLDEIRKNDFIGMVSHELKTPLTSLSAILQVAKAKLNNSDDVFLAGAMQKANQQVKRMTAMINGFLNISRLESGKILIQKHPFNLAKLITDVVDEVKVTATTHTITIDGCEAVEVNADEDKIQSVISNLISNAVKYSSTGTEVLITCNALNNEVVVSVADQGIGIKPADAERIFDRYYRVETHDTKHISGFGIGLYLSAEIIHHHNGRIWLDSEPGKGSTFYFSLPLLNA